MAKTIELTLHARLKIYYWLARIPGNAEMQDVYEGIEKAVVLSPEERVEVGLDEELTEAGEIQSAAWKPGVAALDATKPCTFEDSHAKKLLTLLSMEYPALRIDRAWVRDAIDKLKAVVR